MNTPVNLAQLAVTLERDYSELQTIMVVLSTIASRIDELNAAVLTMRRNAIKLSIFMLVPDAADRDRAEQFAHDAGLLTSPEETMMVDIIAALKPWMTLKEMNHAR
jgi:hypothetical protein